MCSGSFNLNLSIRSHHSYNLQLSINILRHFITPIIPLLLPTLPQRLLLPPRSSSLLSGFSLDLTRGSALLRNPLAIANILRRALAT
jgi:hypothetical protein